MINQKRTITFFVGLILSFSTLLAQNEGDIGLLLEPEPCSGYAVITGFLPKSPAALANIGVDDLLVEIDDESIAKQRISEVQKKLKGQPGTYVRLGLKSGKRAYFVTLARQDLTHPDLVVEPFTTINGKPYKADTELEKEAQQSPVLSAAGPKGLMPTNNHAPKKVAEVNSTLTCIYLQTIISEANLNFKHIKRRVLADNLKWESSVTLLNEKESFIVSTEKDKTQWEAVVFESMNKTEAEAFFNNLLSEIQFCNRNNEMNLINKGEGKDCVWNVLETAALPAAKVILSLHSNNNKWQVKTIVSK